MVVINHPEIFKTGYRILLRTHRSKEGGTNRGDRHSKKYVSFGNNQYEELKNKLISEMRNGERVYSSVNERDFDKAVMLFKHRQLDADYQDKESFEAFYIDIYNRWVSSLANKSARKDRLFLIDGDYDDGATKENYSNELCKKTNIVYGYDTKNGFHMVVEPFDYTGLSFKDKIGFNEMLLVAYYNDDV